MWPPLSRPETIEGQVAGERPHARPQTITGGVAVGNTGDDAGVDLTGSRVAVLGGDARELEIMRRASAAGAMVVAFGTHPGAARVARAEMAPGLSAAVNGADIIICPVPLMDADDTLYAPFAAEPVRLDREVLSTASPGALVVTGSASPALTACGLRVREINDDAELAILHAIPTAEGLVRGIIEQTDFTIHGANILVLGFGPVGRAAGSLLHGMRARVSVAARQDVQLAEARVLGLTPIPFDVLADALAGRDVIVNTIPVLVLGPELLERVERRTLVVDLASPPGGVAHEAGRARGLTVIWARGQAGSAPATAGANQWRAIARVIAEERASPRIPVPAREAR